MLACFCVEFNLGQIFDVANSEHLWYLSELAGIWWYYPQSRECHFAQLCSTKITYVYVKVISEIAESSVLIENQNTINFCLCVWNLSNWNSNFIFNLILTFIFYFCVYRYDCGSYICDVTHVEAKRELLVVRSFLPWCGFWGLNQIVRLGDRQSCHFVSLYSVSFENQTL